MTKDVPTDTIIPLFALGSQRFTVVVMVSAYEETADADDAEDQAIEAGLTEEETATLLADAAVGENEELGEETYGLTLALWADDPQHAEREAHKATRAVLDDKGMDWIALRTAAVFAGHPPSIQLEPPLTTWAEDSNPTEAVMDAVMAEPLFPADLGND